MDAAKKIMERLDALGKVSEEPDRLTRQFASPAMREANELVGSWMKEAGMTVRQDAIGNLIGHYPGATPEAKILLLGSHLDTVRNAGKYDGPLGVVLAIAAVEQLQGKRLPFAIEVVGFADEEGVRYQSTYLGSRALAGNFDENILSRPDANDITLAEAIKQFGGNPDKIKDCKIAAENYLGYIEAHIEQGPLLEKHDHAVGVVTAIAGQTRAKVTFTGKAGHAGTTPMDLRQDALCLAAEYILAVEIFAKKTTGLVATVGQIHTDPNVSNVIPGSVMLTLDIRHQDDLTRMKSAVALGHLAEVIAERRKLATSWQTVQETASVPCSPKLSALLHQAATKHQDRVPDLLSGAGHDAAVLGKIMPAAMLFVRCKDGLSHHPDESITGADAATALAVLNEFIALLIEQK